MLKIDIDEIKDITADRHKSACDISNNTTKKEYDEDNVTECNEGECQIDWQEH